MSSRPVFESVSRCLTPSLQMSVTPVADWVGAERSPAGEMVRSALLSTSFGLGAFEAEGTAAVDHVRQTCDQAGRRPLPSPRLRTLSCESKPRPEQQIVSRHPGSGCERVWRRLSEEAVVAEAHQEAVRRPRRLAR